MAKKSEIRKIKLALVGYGVVGQGVVRMLRRRQDYIRDKFNTEFVIRTICDRSIHKKDTRGLSKTLLTKDINKVLNDPEIDVVVELMGGMHPAKEIVEASLKSGKNVVTANKHLIANHGREIFKLAQANQKHFYFESAVGAGIPIIKSITEGVAGNKFEALYGIVNGTCNFILTEMTQKDVSFGEALEEAQRRGYAESNPTLDINGKDSAHKLAILVYLAFGKFVKLEDIYTEGISQISHDDIEHAESLNLSIKLLAIAKKYNDRIEARVHPTLISKDHPLASINGVYNAFYLHMDPLGNILLSGQGAGQPSAASGVISDLINFASHFGETKLLSNIYSEASNVRVQKIDQVKTRFYIRFMATDKPGVLSKITGILGRHGISIMSVTQKASNSSYAVPVVMLTNYTNEKMLRLSLEQIYKLSIVKSKPVAIRMEKLQ